MPVNKRFVRLPGGGTGFEELISKDAILDHPKGKYILETCGPGAFQDL